MGVDAADFDGDGDQDLFMTHVIRETNTLYVNDGNGWFEDQTVIMGLANPSFSYTGFGTAWFDYDNDGWLDLFIANGSVSMLEDLVKAGDPFPLRQPNQLFRNVGKGRYEETSDQGGRPSNWSKSAVPRLSATSTTTVTRICWWATRTPQRVFFSTRWATATPGWVCA